jgi:hypothetical protein
MLIDNEVLHGLLRELPTSGGSLVSAVERA